jgi:hypothetical protein
MKPRPPARKWQELNRMRASRAAEQRRKAAGFWQRYRKTLLAEPAPAEKAPKES